MADARKTIRSLDKLSYNINEAAQLLGVSRSGIYARINSGELPSRRIFGRVVLLAEDLQRVVEQAKAR